MVVRWRHSRPAGPAIRTCFTPAARYNERRMARPAASLGPPPISARFGAFVAEQHPALLRVVLEVFTATGGGKVKHGDKAGLDALRPLFRRELASRLYRELSGGEALDETTPGVSAIRRLEQARAEVLDACDGFAAARGDRGVAHERGTQRDPARHVPDPRRRQPPEAVLPRRGSALGRRRPSRARASARSARRRSTPPAIRLKRGAKFHDGDGDGALERRRHRAADPRSRRDAGHARRRRRGQR